ncbi:hypothetical protein DL96DRAFT_1706287 [Flagelloscypha sp. PMI_526]|nr:hypothetical protein DL96DRAFT_1706287 [Flagelloscypha sp. PMI_526]
MTKIQTQLQAGLVWAEQQISHLSREMDAVSTLKDLSLKPFPPIPMDLGRYIFELSAEIDSETRRSLTYVSKDVQNIADTRLFRTINMSYMDEWGFCDKLDAAIPPRILRGFLYMKSLIWNFHFPYGGAPKYFKQMLSLCRNLEVAALDCPDNEDVIISKEEIPVSLRSLACRTDLFQLSSKPIISRSSLTHPIFLQLTHLNVETSLLKQWDASPLRAMTRLTHLHLDAYYVDSSVLLVTLEGVISHLPSKILILVVEMMDSVTTELADEFNRFQDGRYDSRLLVGMSYLPEDEFLWILETPQHDPGSWLDDDYGLQTEPMTMWGRGMKLLKERNSELVL